ncbi:asparagine synthase (glutamine-hydrolyzing) [Duganella violaceipulchra]|uniref:asparagine synthase (glutamine-hydrolyzing) n=1 Tax=Duganella violaceipulchra TaxID=2849652 RepID=A0AA41HJE0_9BURK|nr:asparagine synthase (glutamine-hydrolyzing) [Duganella violaceicalia]MBV6325609.1 asparagine synthase (glutamine-hydrolyzing) [Duganella violaceicalia]MCP2010922.1 asparagine synthase (glutamine-hydrolyzing) [Duganella violaceicalia]
MCGIAGTLDLNHQRATTEGMLVHMANQLIHRGPDDAGYCLKNEVGLAFRRLSIIDLKHGNQPFFSDDGRIVSICNGEIYNYRELRHELQQKGYRFKTECDVEVLIPLYQEYGLEFMKKLNGQFGFAIFDDAQKQLLLVRDHVGICPLFYTVAAGSLVFGSEIKAVIAHPAVKRAVNLRGLDQVLSFPGSVSPTTMFENISALRPGHYLLVKTNGALQEKEYWDLNFGTTTPDHGDDGQYLDEFDEILRRAVKDRLNADVPVGYYLSGGLDSSLIGSVAQAVAPDPLRHSFSIAFDDAEHDERSFQRAYTQHIPSTHHEIQFDWKQVAERLRSAVYYSEAPLKESYNTCSLALSELVRDSGVKVVLTGEGADELFAGYVGYRFDAMRAGQVDGVRELDEMLEDEERNTLWGNKSFFYEKNYLALKAVKLDLYSPAVGARFGQFNAVRSDLLQRAKMKGRHPIHQRSYVDFKLRLSDHLLADHGDRVSYANSIEARYPFLDIRMVEFAARLPPRLKLNGLVEKYIVKEVARRYLPASIFQREKFHFVAPGSPALLAQNIDWVNELLSPEVIAKQGYFNPETVERLRKVYARPGFKLNLPFDSDLLMTVLTFGIFLQTFGMPDH